MSVVGAGVAAAKSAMRKAIMEKIKKLKDKVRKAKEVKREIKQVKSQIDNDISMWERSLGAFESSPMAPVKVTDKFEGESAETISAKIPEPIDIMQETVSGAQDVQNEVDVQLDKLDAYIELLEQQIEALYAQLAAI